MSKVVDELLFLGMCFCKGRHILYRMVKMTMLEFQFLTTGHNRQVSPQTLLVRCLSYSGR